MSSILITGSGRGIGRATALELVRRGHRVIAIARDPGQLADLPVDVRLQLDVTDAHSVEQAIRAAATIDVLISNAGAMFSALVEAPPPDEAYGNDSCIFDPFGSGQRGQICRIARRSATRRSAIG